MINRNVNEPTRLQTEQLQLAISPRNNETQLDNEAKVEKTDPPCNVCKTRERASPCWRQCSQKIIQRRQELSRLAMALQFKKKEKEALQRRVEELLAARNRQNLLVVKRERVHHRVQKAKEKMAKQRKWLEEEGKQIVDLRVRNQEKSKRLKEAIFQLENTKHRLFGTHEYKSGLSELKREARLRADEVVRRRKELTLELFTLFPVLPLNESQCRIVNIMLPNNGDYSTIQPIALASGLGYIVHIVKILAIYLDVSLPFCMDSCGSNSTIYSKYNGKRYPLFRRAGEEREFGMAIRALLINIAFLCSSQGLVLTKAQYPQILLNLRRLLQSRHLGCNVPPEHASNQLSRDKLRETATGLGLGDWEMILPNNKA
jgi:hypothetical protein